MIFIRGDSPGTCYSAPNICSSLPELCGKPVELPCVMPLPANSPCGPVNVSFCFAQNAIQIVRIIKMIGAITVVVPRNFIATLFTGVILCSSQTDIVVKVQLAVPCSPDARSCSAHVSDGQLDRFDHCAITEPCCVGLTQRRTSLRAAS